MMTSKDTDKPQAHASVVVQAEQGVRRPSQAWMWDVAPGDMLRIKPLWNNTERYQNRIPVPCQVLAVQVEAPGCQSGALFTVRANDGSYRTLDAGWFEPPNVRGNAPTRAERTDDEHH